MQDEQGAPAEPRGPTTSQTSPSHTPSKQTFPLLQRKKQCHEPIVAMTAYDYPTARLVDAAGIDLVLVGDSLGMAVLGYDSTLPVTMEEMLHHTRAVRRGVRRALLVADLPFGSYEANGADGVQNAVRLVKEGGAEAVKFEGGSPTRMELVRRMVEAEIPVVGHLGLTPQAVHRMGGYRVQARTLNEAELLREQAVALQAAGASAVVLEGVPREVAEQVTAALAVPTIGIGAGPGCDGQILVLHDLIGLGEGRPPAKFVRQYVDTGALLARALEAYARDVREGRFPSDEESYHLGAGVREAFGSAGGSAEEAGKTQDAVVLPPGRV